MPPKRTIDSFFKKIHRDGDGVEQEQNNSPVVCPQPQLDAAGVVQEEAPNPGEQRTPEEAPREPAPKVQRVNAEASVLIVERDPGLRRQIW